MILLGFAALIALAAVVGLVNWRAALYAFVVIGLLQDPVRKLVPGVPGYLVLSTTPVWIAMVTKMLATRSAATSLAAVYPPLGSAVRLFLVSIVPAALISATYGSGSWQITVMGAFTYLSLLYSVQLGYLFARRVDDLRRFIGFYCAGVAILLSGTLMEYFAVPFPALGTEMLGTQWIRWIPGTIVHMVAGFFRSPDIMGWHAATMAMLALTLALSGRGPSRWFWVGMAFWGAGLAGLCGRRKMVYMLPFFIVLFTLLFSMFGRRVRIVTVVVTVAIALAGFAILYQQVEPDEAFMTYYTDSPGDVVAQVERHGFDALVETIRQSGVLGEGLGMASTGAHHLSVERPRIWQESGPSRLLVELGVSGFVCFFLLGLVTLRILWRTFRTKLPKDSPNLALWIGLFAMVLANGGSFIVSGQIFGDPFITCMLAFFIGAVFASVRVERIPQGLRRTAVSRVAPAPGLPSFPGRMPSLER